MSEFTVNATRFDPYKNFKFRVKWDGKYVAGISKVTSLKRTTRGGQAPARRRPKLQPEVTRAHRVGGRHTQPRGHAHVDFERWANKVWNYGSGLGAETSLKDFRKDIISEAYNEAGEIAQAYKVFRCWVSEFESLPELDANLNAVAIQTIKLENEGWERDYSVAEPMEPSFVEP